MLYGETFIVIPVTKGARIGPKKRASYSSACRHYEIKKINWMKFCVWGSAGIFWEKLIFAFGGGESFKGAFIFTVLSVAVQDEGKNEDFYIKTLRTGAFKLFKCMFPASKQFKSNFIMCLFKYL